MKTTFAPVALVAFALFAVPAEAQARKELGRMWTFEAAPLGWFQEAYDWQPTKEWLDHARLSSLRFGMVNKDAPGGVRFFCSASFVSPHGLIMTNHHCSRDAIASVQGDADWLKDGFYAGSYEYEVKLPGFLMTQMVRQQDVTAAVNEKGKDGAKAVEAEAKAQDPDHMHQVVALYQGGAYQLYSFKVFDDLRLVCAPHGQSAHFGGDPDNFCYPRWGLDFSFLRAYANDKPVDSKENYFGWRTEGAKEGDLVFVTGNPGSTGRLRTYAQCEYLRDRALPARLEQIHKDLAEANAKAKESTEAEKQQRPKILSLENGRKAIWGYLDGLKTPRIMAIKQKAESDLRASVAKNDELQKKYGDAWDVIARLQSDKVEAAGDADKVKGADKMKAIAAEETAQNKRIGEACFAVYGTSIPPDATMSLRLSDGLVKGYSMNGTLAPYFTTLYGLFARHAEFGGEHPFDVPQAWLDKEKELDLKTPFNFVATCDIIGGNSGSPMIDKERRIIGLVFDGNIEMLGNNYVFDDEVSRTVSVHPAIIIESLRKVYGASKLADELEQKTAGGEARRTGSADAAKPPEVERRTAALAEAKALKSQTDVRALADAVRYYRTKNGKLPESLDVLAQKDNKGRSYVEELPLDGYGNPYVLIAAADSGAFEVVCCGADGKQGTADDVSSKAKK